MLNKGVAIIAFFFCISSVFARNCNWQTLTGCCLEQLLDELSFLGSSCCIVAATLFGNTFFLLSTVELAHRAAAVVAVACRLYAHCP